MYTNALAVLALLASSVVAQGTAGLPSCATSCISNYGGCNQVDVKCICSNTQLLETLSCCVSQKCSSDDQKKVVQFADTLCGSYGVTTLPQAASCAAATSTASSGSGTATSPSTASATATGTASSSAASSAASASASHTGTASASASSASSASASASSATQSAGVCKNYKAEGLGMGVALLGFLAAL
ncbi:Hypothetical predicted protein [Lecanosticta acicola]|uniref:CFEM domain-containing protein n=1 Tax=Lecanosticta acicola TaxID=111012 RepID=A0AAI8YT72_9PEZI|nr:Hypothetical predicted protein [Lecanosticta acicola]